MNLPLALDASAAGFVVALARAGGLAARIQLQRAP